MSIQIYSCYAVVRQEKGKKNRLLLDDLCQFFWEICHYKTQNSIVNIDSMYRTDYAQFSIFSGLDGNQITQLSPFLAECRFPKDHVVFEQGQPAENLYILLGGEVVINYKPYDGPILTVARIDPGGVFGWSSALQRDVYTSAAITTQESFACRLRGSNLHTICAQYPDTGKILLERLASVIAERLRSTHTQVLGMLTMGMGIKSDCSGKGTKND